MNPTCNVDLFHFFDSGQVTSIEELAHIIGSSVDGPRGDDPLPLSQRDEYENIILLCPTCHTLIDKAKGQFPAEALREWKREHEGRLTDIFSVPSFPTRELLRTEIKSLLRRNKAIFDAYGPYSARLDNPMDPRAKGSSRCPRLVNM